MNSKVLEIGGVDCMQLAKAAGTPLIVYDEHKIETQLEAAINSFRSEKFSTKVVYASKAFSCKAMYEKVKEAGACLDVVSGGELYCAMQSGFPMENVYFHGNNKSAEELELALKYGCGTVVIDNEDEAVLLTNLAAEADRHIDTLLRVNPGIEAHTHEYIMTSGSDSKFGISIKRKDEILRIMKCIDGSSHVAFRGFHSHIGSQITETTAFNEALSIMLDFTNEMQETSGIRSSSLSIGGGFGIRYTEDDKPVPLGDIAAELACNCERFLKEKDLSIDELLIEPGRSIAGEAGSTLYTVGFLKDTDTKHYLFVDGGMSDNIRPALYQAEYECDIVNRMDEPKNRTYCVAGKNCESGDILIQQADLPDTAQPGDLLIMYSTGAYGYSMASNYNRAGRPAVVFAKDGKARIVLRRETYEDQLRYDTNGDITL